MVAPDSFCSVCTKGCVDELVAYLISLSIHHRNAHFYLLCDNETKYHVKHNNPTIQLNLHIYPELDDYSSYNRQEMERLGIWQTFQMQKAEVIKKAFNDGRSDTMLMDSDILVLHPLEVDNSKDLNVSPHYINKRHTDRFGYYNGGCLWTKNIEVANDWIEFTKTSRFYDQASIEDLAKKYDHYELDETYNFAWWRTCPLHNDESEMVKSRIQINDENQICYNKSPIKFIHTHFYKNGDPERSFNMMFFGAFIRSKNYKMMSLIRRIVNKKWVLRIPQQPMDGLWNHNDDSFRELAQMIEKKQNDVQIQKITNSGFCWLDPSILLYDRPTKMWYDLNMPQVKVSSLMLLGNGSFHDEEMDLRMKGIENVKPWIFWPRRPLLVEQKLDFEKSLYFKDRTTQSVFIGNYENQVQAQYRDSNQDWKSCIEEFHCTSGTEHKFSQEEYLCKLAESKFGLCLRGFGSKCHREIECMAFGTIPLITPEVSINYYMNPPQENVHYLKVSSPEEAKEKMDALDEESWTKMSEACKEWYMQNVHSNNTMNTILTNIFYN